MHSKFSARHQWPTPVILATQEAEIWRIMVRKPAQANSSRDLISKEPNTKKQGWQSVSSGRAPAQQPWGLDFKRQCCQNKNLIDTTARNSTCPCWKTLFYVEYKAFNFYFVLNLVHYRRSSFYPGWRGTYTWLSLPLNHTLQMSSFTYLYNNFFNIQMC
jgi:hypothetical protein